MNVLLSFASLSMQFSSSAVLVMILARLVDVDTFGEILYAIAFANIAIVVVSFGFEDLVIREVSQGHYSIQGIIPNILTVKLILSTVAVLGVMLFIKLVHIPLKHPEDLWWYFGATLINSFMNSLSALRKGKNDFATDMKVSLFSNSLLFGGTLGATLCWRATTLLLGRVRLFCRLASLLFAVFIFVRKLQAEEYSVSKTGWRGPNLSAVWELFVTGFPFGIQSVLGHAYFRLDVIVLGALRSSAEVGFYQSPMQLVSAVMLIPLAITRAYYPKLAKMFLGMDAKGLLLMRQMMRILLVSGLCLALLFGLGASFIITIVYSTKMEPSIPAMRILSLLFILRFVAAGLGISLMAMGLQKIAALADFVALIGSLGLGFWLIPKGGFITAAWVNVLMNCCILCICALGWIKGQKVLRTHSLFGPVELGDYQSGQEN